MFLIIAAVLFVLWLLGFIGNVGGGLINILIVAALILSSSTLLMAGDAEIYRYFKKMYDSSLQSTIVFL